MLRTSMVLFFALAFFVALHQFVNWNTWFELKDLHHETFIVAFVFGGFLCWWLVKRGRKQ